MNYSNQSRYKSNNVRFQKKCDLCGASGHLARGCTLNKVEPQAPIVVVSYNSGTHNHLAYIKDNINKFKFTTKASIILSRFLDLDIEKKDDILIQIEELAYSQYNEMRKFVTKEATLSEMNTLKNKINGNMNIFIQIDGVYTVAKFIVANAGS